MKHLRYHNISSDAELRTIGERFCTGTITRSAWTHQAHVAAAVYLIAIRSDIVAETEMPLMIRALNANHGVANTASSGYHHTITLAFLAAIRSFMRERGNLAPHELVNEAIQTSFGSIDWLLDYWSRDLLFSHQARREWVEPDKLAWPFERLKT